MGSYPTSATMPDPVVTPGVIAEGIRIAISLILQHINIARRYRKELDDLKDSLMTIEPVIKEIQLIRLARNNHKDEASAVDKWFEKLDALLKKASEIVHPRNLIGKWGVVSRYQITTKITDLTKDIYKHLTLSALVHMVQYHELTRKILEGQMQINEKIEALMASSSSSAITSQAAHAPIGTINSEKGDKTLTGIASRLSNLSKVSSFQDQQLDSHIFELFENPVAGYVNQNFESHGVKEEDRTENQWFRQALCVYPASRDDELNLTAGEEFEILDEQEEYFYVSKKLPGRDGKVAGWVPVFFVNSHCSCFSVATTMYLQEGKTGTGTANRLSNPSKVSSFQHQQLDAHLPRDGPPSYESTTMHIFESYENHDAEEEDCTENHWLGKASRDFPALCDAEVNLTAGEEVKILAEEEEWFYVCKKRPGRDGKMEGWVPMVCINSY